VAQVVFAVVLWSGQAALGQLPATRLDGIFPAGGTPGQSVDLTIYGGDLDDVDRLVFSHPGITAERRMAEPGPFDEGPQPVENQFTVTIKGDVPFGHHAVRCQGRYGLSGPRTFVVDGFTELVETEPNNQRGQATELATLPLAVNGQLNGGADVDWFRIAGQAGQRLLVDAYARRIDSRSDAIVTLVGSDNRVLAESRQAIAGDPLLDVTLPAAGTYFVRVHDALYGGGGDFPYRLLIGAQPVIEFVFPPSGLPGSNEEYTVYGRNLPGGQQSGMTRQGRPLEQVKVRIAIPGDIADRLVFGERLDPHQGGLDGLEYRMTSPAGVSNPVLITVATAPLVLEQDNNNSPATAQKLTLPCEVAGQFYPQRDADWYTFDAKAGDVYWMEIYSHRLGLPTDPTLVIQRVERPEGGEETVTQIAWVDDSVQRDGGFEFDQRTHDPSYQFTAPADGTYRVLVREGFSSLVSDPRLTYRLAIRSARPDFRLAAVPVDSSGAVFLRRGGREAVRVVVFRQDGFDGEIRVSATGLPQGVTSSEVILGPATGMTTVILTADAGAPAGIGQLQITGTATVNGQAVSRRARSGHPLQAVPFAQPNNAGQPSLPARLTDSLPVVVTEAETSRVSLTLTNTDVIETSRGGLLKLKYTVKREDGSGGNLQGFPVGLPPNIGLPQVGIGGNEGEFELRLQANTPPGTYSFYLAAMMQGMNYSRNPEAAARAKERQERIGKIFTQAQQSAQQAQQTAQQAQNTLNQSNNELNAANAAKASADQAAASADSTLKSATDVLNAVMQQLAAKPEDAGLKQQVENARKAVDDATQKAKTASENAASAAKKQEEATATQKAAQEAKTKADQDQQAAQQFQQQAQQEKQRADQTASQLQQQANPRGFNLIIPSTPVTIRIAEYPVNLNGVPDRVTVKQGEKLDIPLKIERLYGFDQNVNVQLQLPGGVGGLQIQNLNIAQNQTDGAITITAQPTATPGDHTVTLRTTLNFNGQGLTLDRTFVLSVEKVEPAAQQ